MSRTDSMREAAILIAATALSRLIPHFPNATLVGSVSLYARSRFGPYGFMIPLIGLVVSDVFIGFYDWRLLASVYVSFATIFVFGHFLSASTSVHRIVAISVTGSTFFFFTTNTAVWALSTWYPHDITGLLTCLGAGLPFYLSMTVADGLGALTLFKAKSIETRARAAIYRPQTRVNTTKVGKYLLVE